MSDLLTAIAHTKALIRERKFEQALAHLHAVDLSSLTPQELLRFVTPYSLCLAALNRSREIDAIHRTALNALMASGQLMPGATARDALDAAVTLAVGANDPALVKEHLSSLMGQATERVANMRIAHAAPLPAWCEAHGIAVHPIDPGQDVAIPDTTGFGRALTYQSQPTWHATIPGAEIVGGWDYAVAPTGEVLTGGSYMPIDRAFAFMPHAYYALLNRVAHVWDQEAAVVDENVLFLSTPENHHYGHWITDFLTRLRGWKAGDDAPRKLAISSGLPIKHRELLAQFGVADGDLIECDIGKRYKFRSLRVVQTSDAPAPNPRNVQFLYERLTPPPDASAETHKARRLFLVRDAGTRMIANMEDVGAVLREFGIETVNPAKLTYTEQAALLAETELIVGAFGTELYCVYNLRPGSAVIELIWDPKFATVYGPIATLLGMRHQLLVCGTADVAGKRAKKFDRDLVVDCSALRHHLTACLGS